MSARRSTVGPGLPPSMSPTTLVSAVPFVASMPSRASSSTITAWVFGRSSPTSGWRWIRRRISTTSCWIARAASRMSSAGTLAGVPGALKTDRAARSILVMRPRIRRMRPRARVAGIRASRCATGAGDQVRASRCARAAGRGHVARGQPIQVRRTDQATLDGRTRPSVGAIRRHSGRSGVIRSARRTEPQVAADHSRRPRRSDVAWSAPRTTDHEPGRELGPSTSTSARRWEGPPGHSKKDSSCGPDRRQGKHSCREGIIRAQRGFAGPG